MHAYATLGLLALAGSALAAPHRGGYRGRPHIVYETVVVTVMVGPDGQPIGGAAPTPAPAPQPQPEQPEAVPITNSYVVEVPSPSPSPYLPPAQPAPVPTPSPEPQPEEPQPEPQPEPSPEPQPSPSPSPSPSPAPPSGGDSGYMSVIKKWRAKMNLPEIKQDATLEKNAQQTCVDGDGQMKHELLPGSFGQVLAPGKCEDSEFERVFVGGWLCERSDLPGLDGVCAEMSKGWAYNGQTGHADILTNKEYTKIGCGCHKGIWGCDTAY